MAEKCKINGEHFGGVVRLREEQEKVVKDCEGRIDHWKKVSGDYEALNDRLKTLPEQLSYDIMVPFGPLAFMPGKLVHTNEVTVLLGDNWFAKCSAKQAQKIVDHRMKYVKHELDELTKTRKNFEARVEFAKGMETMSRNKDDYVDIREDVENNETVVNKGKHRVAHKPKSKPKLGPVIDLKEEDEEEELENRKSVLSEEELWARLDELEKLEELQDEQDRLSDTADMNGEDTSSSSSEEEKDGDPAASVNGVNLKPSWTTGPPSKALPITASTKDDDEEEEVNCLPTIYFSHTVELKKVRINTGKNTTLKYSERKEQKDHSKKKKKNGHSNGHPEHYKITTPADIYRLFVDVKNGELLPRKSILKSRSRENSVCSDTSESSAADFEERRMIGRSFSHDDTTTHSDTSDGITEEDSPILAPAHPSSRFEAFSGTVIEKDPMPTSVPHLTIAHPALPTILERKQEEVWPEAFSTSDSNAPPPAPPEPNKPEQTTKKLSKFKAARLQQK